MRHFTHMSQEKCSPREQFLRLSLRYLEEVEERTWEGDNLRRVTLPICLSPGKMHRADKGLWMSCPLLQLHGPHWLWLTDGRETQNLFLPPGGRKNLLLGKSLSMNGRIGAVCLEVHWQSSSSLKLILEGCIGMIRDSSRKESHLSRSMVHVLALGEILICEVTACISKGS